MKASLTFEEIRDYVVRKFGYVLDVQAMGRDSVLISYNPGRLLPTLHVGLQVHTFSTTSIILRYHCHAVLGVGKLMELLLKCFRKKFESDLVELKEEEHQLILHWDRMKKIKKVFSVLQPKELYFTKQGIVVEGDLQ